ncbi:MAG: gas vesicle protein [Actinomycetota bacterium]|nr:gas vesicle protein [Actinomycetota bacterium]
MSPARRQPQDTGHEATARNRSPERRSSTADRSSDNSGEGQNSQATHRSADIRSVISSARGQLQDLTGRPTEAVTSVERVQDGWRLSIEVVELERIPPSTSILGSYDVQVDQDGNLLEYARTGRYHRNQAGEAE